MKDTYVKSFFTNEQTDEIFANSYQSMEKIHQNEGPYKRIADFLAKEAGMDDPLCVQTFFVDKSYAVDWPHIDVGTSFFPSIMNLWFCADDCPGASFGYLKYEGNDELYAEFKAGLERGEISYYDELCSEGYSDKYWRVTDYKKGDALFFDSRQVHKKLSLTPRQTLVFKYISRNDLDDHSPINYSKIPPGPEWVRILVFDHLRFIEGRKEQERFIRETEVLIASTRSSRPEGIIEKSGGSNAKSFKQRLKQLLG